MKKLNEGSKYWLQLFHQMCSQASIDEWDGIDFYDIAKAAQSGDKSAKEAIFWQMRNIIEATYAKNKKSVYLWSNQLGLFEKNPEGPSQVNEMALNWISTSWTVIFDGYPVSDGETVGPLIKHVQPTKGLDYLSWIYSKKILNLLYKEYYLNSSTGLSKNKGIDSISANLYADKRQDNGGEHSIKREIIDDWQSETNLPEEDLAVSDALRSFRKFTRDPELNEKKHGFSPMIAFRTVIMNMAKGADAEKNVANLAAKYNVSRNTFASYAKEAATTLVNKYDVSLDELQQLIKVYGSGALGRLIKESSYKPKPLARINENYDFRLLESIFNGKILLSESDISNNVVITDFSDDLSKNLDIKRVKIADGVTAIEEKAFYECRNLTEVIIPDSVTTIGKKAFEFCIYLNSITIPNSVTFIGKDAFSCCYNLKSITIPNSVTSIEEGAFGHCKNLASITIPNSVTTIKRAVFSYCQSLTEIIIPEGVTDIEDQAFRGCNSLKSITIPKSVTTIGRYVFKECETSRDIDDKCVIHYMGTRDQWDAIKKDPDWKGFNIRNLVINYQESSTSDEDSVKLTTVKENKKKYWNNFFDSVLKESRGTYTGNIAKCPCCGHTIRQDQYEDYTCEECGEFWEDDDLDWYPDGDEYEDGEDNRVDIDPLELMSESVSLKEHENPYAPRAAAICKSLTKDIDFDNDDNAWDKAADILVEFIDSMIEQSMDYFPVDEYEPELYKIWEEHEKRHE